MTAPKRGPGRPPKGDVAKSEVINIRATPPQLARWQAKAAKCGETVREWAQRVLDAASGRET